MMICENRNNILYSNLDVLIEKGSLEEKKIVLFGLNTSSYVTKKYLEQKGYCIYAYIDNNDKKVIETTGVLTDILPRHLSGQMYEGIKQEIVRVYKPEELLKDYQKDVVILIASKYYPSMCSQLEKLGYREEIQIFKTLDFYGIEKMLQKDNSDLTSRELDTTEIRKVQLEITLYLKEVCEKNNLRYYMTGGTLLGAVRHKGYIPWDDDIDITIPMCDYKKLIEILIADNRYDVFTVYNEPEKCSNFYMRIIDRNTIMKLWEYPFLTTSGVSIDVFPLVGLPERMDETMVFFNRIRYLNTMYMKSFIEEVNGEVGIEEVRKNLREEVLEMMEYYPYDSCTNAGYILSKYWERDIMPRVIYCDTIEMPFEHITLAAPVGYHDYLERIFGDYMQLPPKQDQYVTHNYKVYRR